MMDLTLNTDQNWKAITDMLPADRDQTARETGAFTRAREIKSSDDLLRLLCFYSWTNLSLRDTAASANEADIASVSDVALLHRFQKVGGWIEKMVGQLLEARLPPPLLSALPYHMRLADASALSLIKSSGTDYRLHASYCLLSQRFQSLEITDATQGESLKRLTIQPGELVIADRAHGHRVGIAQVLEQGGQVLLRFAWNHLPLQTRGGEVFDLMTELMRLKPGETGDWEVQTAPVPAQELCALRGRVVAIPHTPEATRKAEAAARKAAKKKHRVILPQTLVACGYLFVFTTLKAEEADATLILALYRFRWQIECAFKQLKSQLHFDHIKARDPALVRAFLFCKLLGAVLIEDLCNEGFSFSP